MPTTGTHLKKKKKKEKVCIYKLLWYAVRPKLLKAVIGLELFARPVAVKQMLRYLVTLYISTL